MLKPSYNSSRTATFWLCRSSTLWKMMPLQDPIGVNRLGAARSGRPLGSRIEMVFLLGLEFFLCRALTPFCSPRHGVSMTLTATCLFPIDSSVSFVVLGTWVSVLSIASIFTRVLAWTRKTWRYWIDLVITSRRMAATSSFVAIFRLHLVASLIVVSAIL